MTDGGGASNGVIVRCAVRTPELLPDYASALAAGADLKAAMEEPLTLGPGQRVRLGTGVRIELPPGYEAQVRPRSGLAHRHGITTLNSPGTIDADYRGEVSVILINLGMSPTRLFPEKELRRWSWPRFPVRNSRSPMTSDRRSGAKEASAQPGDERPIVTNGA